MLVLKYTLQYNKFANGEWQKTKKMLPTQNKRKYTLIDNGLGIKNTIGIKLSIKFKCFPYKIILLNKTIRT